MNHEAAFYDSKEEQDEFLMQLLRDRLEQNGGVAVRGAMESQDERGLDVEPDYAAN